MMSNKDNLRRAKKAKNDEFYTRLEDIEKELNHYKNHFKGKVVYCNCDNPEWSNFYVYFKTRFSELGLKKLITTHYHPTEAVYKLEVTKDREAKTFLNGTGDFRSPECIETLKEADVVVTNPPFSLFREYVAQLVEYDKKFVIIGNQNAITYKEIYPLIKGNKLWLGASAPSNMRFLTPNGGLVSVKGTWFTNVAYTKQRERLLLTATYCTKNYPKYDNYDAIEVSKLKDIPVDYDGVMGVPITFLSKHSPEQFEIVQFRVGDDGKDLSVDGKQPYFRILIRAK